MRPLAFLALLFCAFLPGALSGQERLCTINQGPTGTAAQEVIGVDTVIVIYDPFTVTCSDGAELRANSGRAFRATGEINLLGDVFFQDADQTLTSDEATYNRIIGRLYATGNVVFENRTDGSTLRGPELEYFRVMEGREVAEVNAMQRPTLTLPPPEDSENPEPLELVADRVLIIGEDDLSAFGNVIITRTDLDARAEEARYNSATEDLELRQNAVVVSEDYELAGEVIQAELTEGELDYVVARTGATLDSEEYQLAGETIEARLVAGAIEHVVSRTGARMDGEDLQLRGEDLQLFFAEELLQRVVASNSGQDSRASAISRSFRLDADSLDATLVDQQLEVVYAIGSARGESIDTTAAAPAEFPAPASPDTAGITVPTDSAAVGPLAELNASAAPTDSAADPLPADSATIPADSTRADLAVASALGIGTVGILASDWIRGDTIIGYFEPVAADSAAVEIPPAPVDSLGAPADDEAPEVEIRRLVAIGSAQSLYRMTPSDPSRAGAVKDINFLVGQRIELELSAGELQVANVTGLEQGVFLEAASPSAPAPEQGAEITPASSPPPGNR